MDGSVASAGRGLLLFLSDERVSISLLLAASAMALRRKTGAARARTPEPAG
jgi:hypothetical protein